jgi:hypothetical protein
LMLTDPKTNLNPISSEPIQVQPQLAQGFSPDPLPRISIPLEPIMNWSRHDKLMSSLLDHQ